MTTPLMKLIAGGFLLAGWILSDWLKIDDPSLKFNMALAAGALLGHSMQQGGTK